MMVSFVRLLHNNLSFRMWRFGSLFFTYTKVKNANKNVKPAKQGNHLLDVASSDTVYIRIWYILHNMDTCEHGIVNGMRPQARLNPSSSLYHYQKCWYVASIFIHKQNTTGSEYESLFYSFVAFSARHFLCQVRIGVCVCKAVVDLAHIPTLLYVYIVDVSFFLMFRISCVTISIAWHDTAQNEWEFCTVIKSLAVAGNNGNRQSSCCRPETITMISCMQCSKFRMLSCLTSLTCSWQTVSLMRFIFFPSSLQTNPKNVWFFEVTLLRIIYKMDMVKYCRCHWPLWFTCVNMNRPKCMQLNAS